MKSKAFLSIAYALCSGAAGLFFSARVADIPENAPAEKFSFPPAPTCTAPAVTSPTPYIEPQEFRLVRRYVKTFFYKCTGYTRFEAARAQGIEDPWKITYASVNFMRGGLLYNPDRPFRRLKLRVRDVHYTAAMPKELKQYHEERIQENMDSPYWGHRYRLFIHGYNKPGTLTVPRDRCPDDSIDCFFSGLTEGIAKPRAMAFGNIERMIDIYRLDWELQNGD